MTDRFSKVNEQKELDRLRNILISLPQMYIIVDAKTLIIKENNVPEPLKSNYFTNYEKLFQNRITSNNQLKTLNIKNPLDIKKPSVFEQTFENPEGNKKYFEVHHVPIENNGKIDEFIEYYFDISERKAEEFKLFEQYQFLNNLFENIQEGIGIVDENENITYCNSSYGKILEESIESIIGKNLKEIFGPDLFPFFRD